MASAEDVEGVIARGLQGMSVDRLHPSVCTSLSLADGEIVPHGVHTMYDEIVAYRARHGIAYDAADIGKYTVREMNPAAGCWAAMGQASYPALKFLPASYVECISLVDKPHEIVCGTRRPADSRECAIVLRALEDLTVWYIELVLCLQLKLERIGNHGYRDRSQTSILRHAFCALMRKEPVYAPTGQDYAVLDVFVDARAAPFAAAIAAIGPQSHAQFFRNTLDTLYFAGFPLLGVGVRIGSPGSHLLNAALLRLGSTMTLQACSMCTTYDLILATRRYESASSVILGEEIMSTAAFVYEMASTQDSSKDSWKVFRSESVEFLVSTKWDPARIDMMQPNHQTYSYTQKLVLFLLRSITGGNNRAIKDKMVTHYILSSQQFQEADEMVTKFKFGPNHMGIIYATNARFTAVDDVHALLVETSGMPAGPGAFVRIANEPDHRERCFLLSMCLSDYWFARNRLVLIVAMGVAVASLRDDRSGVDPDRLRKITTGIATCSYALLLAVAKLAESKMRNAVYTARGGRCTYDTVSLALQKKYELNGIDPNFGSIGFSVGYWSNMLNLLERLSTDSFAELEAGIMENVHTFLGNAMHVLCINNPAVYGVLDRHEKSVASWRPTNTAESLSTRLEGYFDVFSVLWALYAIDAASPHRDAVADTINNGGGVGRAEPPPKEPRQ